MLHVVKAVLVTKSLILYYFPMFPQKKQKLKFSVRFHEGERDREMFIK